MRGAGAAGVCCLHLCTSVRVYWGWIEQVRAGFSCKFTTIIKQVPALGFLIFHFSLSFIRLSRPQAFLLLASTTFSKIQDQTKTPFFSKQGVARARNKKSKKDNETTV